MALSGSFTGTTSNQYVQPKITWSATQNIAENYSTVTATLTYSRTNSGYTTSGRWNGSITINGVTTSVSTTEQIYITQNSNTFAMSATVNVPHNADGSKSTTISCTGAIPAASLSSTTCSATVALDTIARASKPSCNGTATMRTTLTINTNRKSSSFTHTLTYKFGGTTGTIATGVGASYPWEVPDLAHLCNNKLSDPCTITCITYNGSTKIGEATCTTTIHVPAKTVPSFPNGDVIIGGGNPITTNAGSTNFKHIINYSFNGKTGKVSEDKIASGIVWWTPYDLAKVIPSATSGNGTITCETYNGTALVGTSDPVSFKAVVPDDSTTKPSFSKEGLVLSPSGSLPSVFDGLYIQGKTGVTAQFTASSTYSTLSDDSYKLSVDGRVYTGNPATSYALTKDGNVELTGTVTDARGYYTQVPSSISVIPYRTPSIISYDDGGYREVICERSDQNGVYTPSGTHLHIIAKRSYSPVMVDGSQKNFCHLKYIFKASGGTWSEERTLLEAADTTSDVIDIIIDDVVTETDKTYLVQLIVEDTIGERIPYDFTIPTDKVTLHLGEGGHGVAVGKYSEATADNEMFESQWDAEFYKDVIVGGDFLIGENKTTLRDYILNIMNGG